MLFLLPVLGIAAEAAAAVTGTILASTGAIGASIAAATTAIGTTDRSRFGGGYGFGDRDDGDGKHYDSFECRNYRGRKDVGRGGGRNLRRL